MGSTLHVYVRLGAEVWWELTDLCDKQGKGGAAVDITRLCEKRGEGGIGVDFTVLCEKGGRCEVGTDVTGFIVCIG